MLERIWRLAEPVGDGVAPELGSWPRPLRQLLFNRGLRTAGEVERFLHPETEGQHDPFLMKDMEAAVERVRRALRNGELMAVYGDFDVDGLTATALLVEVLESLGARVVAYLPHRVKEGYGLNPEAMRGLAAKGVKLLVTADCGVGAHRELALASDLGTDVVVTDHHRILDGIPKAVAVLNPRQEGCAYPDKELAGVGVAYKLAEALLAVQTGPVDARRQLEPRLDLVALGTVADLAPLLGENRLMVKLGLGQLNHCSRPGLRALASVAGFAKRTVDTSGIAYGLAPRLNAAGRMGDARLGLDLLLARSEEEAAPMAAALEAANRERQSSTHAALNAAREELSRRPEVPPAIVLAGDYAAGIVGLVAGRLAEEFHRPSFVIELGATESRGSGRGIAGFDVARALAGAADLLIRFGGHPLAGGFAVATAHVPALQARLEREAEEQLGVVPPKPELRLEARLQAADLGPALHEKLALLEPCGAGNEPPLFFSPRVLVRDMRVVGSSHLRLWLADESGPATAIGFGMANGDYAFVRPGAYVDCAYRLGRDERGGTIGYEMVLKELRAWSASCNSL